MLIGVYGLPCGTGGGGGESPTTKRSNAGDEMTMREWKQIGAV